MRLPARFLFSARPDPPPALRYAAGILLAAAAQLARLPLHPPTSMSSITYVPFMVLAAAYGGFGPGLVASTLCVMESLFFAIEPVGSLRVADPRHWEGLTALMFTGLVVSLLFEQVRKARHADRSARELKTLLEQTYEAVFVWELDGGRITFWNRAAERMYGFSAAWVLGRSSHGLLATVFPVGAQNYAAAIEASGCWEGELIHTCRDGRQIVVESRMAAHRSNDGRLRVIEITRDISERKRLETVQARLAQEREERELTLQFIIQHSPACLALLRGPDFVFESVNPAYAALCPGEPIVGRTVAEVWPEAAPIVLPLLTTVREAGTVYHATEARIPRRPSAGEAAEIRY
ncbi:MAG TPA: PAS domain-containing protein, partial [Candidatus Sulfopaludibacter sp.]|nr:PAS domain-containing protein [Candidatus Sulfopaludibacter sp.]